jgi:hypothetical protein
METPSTRHLWLRCLLLITAGIANAEIFTHKDEAEHFEVVVTHDDLVVKERYHGASTIYGDLSCPLGSAVRASVLPLTNDRRLCFNFSRERCEFMRFQNGNPIHAEVLGNASPRMCIALANAQDAQRLVALVNAGPRSGPPVGSTGPSETQQAIAVPPAASPAEKAGKIAPPPRRPGAPTAPAAAAGKEREGTGSTAPARDAKSSTASARHPVYRETTTPSGKWITESFVVGPTGNRRMAERTYAVAYVLDDGPGRPPGLYVSIKNRSDKHLLFYGLGNEAQKRLEPGAEVIVPVKRNAARAGARQQTVTLLWFDRAPAARAQSDR